MRLMLKKQWKNLDSEIEDGNGGLVTENDVVNDGEEIKEEGTGSGGFRIEK